MEMCQAATPQLKVFSSFATLSCSWQFVIVLATLKFQFIAFKQRVRLCDSRRPAKQKFQGRQGQQRLQRHQGHASPITIFNSNPKTPRKQREAMRPKGIFRGPRALSLASVSMLPSVEYPRQRVLQRGLVCDWTGCRYFVARGE